MDNELVYSADATYQKAQYDASAKRLLGQKIILAHILIRIVDEFKGMDAETVASLIEGEPYIQSGSGRTRINEQRNSGFRNR